MLRSLSHAVIYVLDLDEAKRFYTEVLGLEERVDLTTDGLRWLTVGAPDDPDHELVLTLAGPPLFDDEGGRQLAELVASGRTYGGVFRTDDCAASHRELQRRGVTFLQEPTRRFNRIDAVFRDPDGNWFSLAEPLDVVAEATDATSPDVAAQDVSRGDAEPAGADRSAADRVSEGAPEGVPDGVTAAGSTDARGGA